jgi:two-component system OmpR family response regulator
MRVLVVEDEEKVATAIARGLRHEGYAVDVAPDGEDALVCAGAYDYDAVVLDLMLPRRDGVEVCRALRTRGCRAPVLMLTALGAVDDRIRGLDAGADDYLRKPFHFGELLARLRALVRRGRSARPALVELGGLRIDPARHAVTRDGEPVALSAREFALLEYLARHPGEVITRTRLLEHVWDANYTGSTNIVDVYVSRLRRKLERPPRPPLVRTVRGVGFVLDLPP